MTNIDNVNSYDGNSNNCYHHNPNNHININKDIDENNEIDNDTVKVIMMIIGTVIIILGKG